MESFTVQEISKITRIPTPTIYRWLSRARGTAKKKKAGVRAWRERIPTAEVTRLLEEHARSEAAAKIPRSTDLEPPRIIDLPDGAELRIEDEPDQTQIVIRAAHVPARVLEGILKKFEGQYHIDSAVVHRTLVEGRSIPKVERADAEAWASTFGMYQTSVMIERTRDRA